MSSESVRDNVYDSPADIWSLGCVVVDMVTGKPTWNSLNGLELSNIYSLLLRIGVGEEVPEIPNELSKDGTDFFKEVFGEGSGEEMDGGDAYGASLHKAGW
ncbi:hypothetical protein K1719_016041 [Acacia pycnantha]|nr:hypothetical protein K1719_016041 [Acacia pycnantha]